MRVMIQTNVPLPPAASAIYVPPVARAGDVHVSSVPTERLAQVDGFFRRNPGYVATSGVADAARGALMKLPTSHLLVGLVTPTELGYGQLIHDQMLWQAASTRQPENRWWMDMNANLVGDPLRAEALVRSGKGVDAAPNAAVAAWMNYVHASDAVVQKVGLPVGVADAENAAGDVQPLAQSDVSRTAPLTDRIIARGVLMGRARQALWDAHMATLEVHYPENEQALRDVAKTEPGEAKVASGWAHFVSYVAKTNALASGRGALLGQQLLPQTQVTPDAQLTLPQRAFAKVLGFLDRARYTSVVGDSTGATGA
jgi:hypothetical protein